MVSWLSMDKQSTQGNYDISKLLDLLNSQFPFAFGNTDKSNLNFDNHQCRVKINPNVQFVIVCYSEQSILTLLGFGSQPKVTTQGQIMIKFDILT